MSTWSERMHAEVMTLMRSAEARLGYPAHAFDERLERLEEYLYRRMTADHPIGGRPWGS